MSASAPRQMTRQRTSLNPFVVLAAGLLLTAALTFGVQRVVNERDRLRFENAVSGTQDRITNRLHAYEGVLRATAALLSVEGDAVTRDRFKQYTSALDVQSAFPGIQGIGFLEAFTGAELPGVEARLRAAGGEGFKIWPEGARPEHVAVIYIEPLDRRNQAAVGYDMLTEELRREAIVRARDTGAVAMSANVTLVQEIDEQKQAGFLIFVPVFPHEAKVGTPDARRAAFEGAVYGAFRADDLFNLIFETERQRVAFTVYDGEGHAPSAMLHSSPREDGHVVLYRTERTLEFGGRRWTLAYETTEAFTEGSSRGIVPYVLAVGLAVSVLLFLITRGQRKAANALIAAEARAESERKNLHALFTQAPAAIAILRGDDFRYELSNPLNQQYAGGRELVGRTIAEAMPDVAAQGLLTLLKHVYASGEPFLGKEVPVEVKQKDGSVRKLYLNGIYEPFRDADGRIEGVMAFAYDVTDQVVARQKVEALAEDLRTAVRTRDDFLSIAGHELKTPLTALSLQLQSLLHAAAREQAAPLPPEAKKRLERAVNHTRRLQALVQELLDVSRISSGRLQLHLERVDAAELVRELVDRFAEDAARTKTMLALRAPQTLAGQWDRIRLEQVLSNLIANALKYGAGKPVEITLEEQPGKLKLSITDHGIGIAAEDQERIFGRFERAVSERHYGGMGLGLWISRQIVDALHGSIRCVSVQGQGSTFTVDLPLEQPR